MPHISQLHCPSAKKGKHFVLCVIYKSSHFCTSIYYGMNISVHAHMGLNIPLEKAILDNFIIEKVSNS